MLPDPLPLYKVVYKGQTSPLTAYVSFTPPPSKRPRQRRGKQSWPKVEPTTTFITEESTTEGLNRESTPYLRLNNKLGQNSNKYVYCPHVDTNNDGVSNDKANDNHDLLHLPD